MEKKYRIGSLTTEFLVGITEDIFHLLSQKVGEARETPMLAIDGNLYSIYKSQIHSIFPHSSIYVIPPGEENKRIEEALNLCKMLVKNKVSRKGCLIAFGGAMTSDLAGFAASMYMRGIPWMICPTSLLAMVDGAIGGKVAVNLDGKNLLGAFYFPQEIWMDPALLYTLPRQEWRSGKGEIIKYAILKGKPEFLRQWKDPSPQMLSKGILEALSIKMEYVLQDPLEKGIRSHLNLGHTFGHGLEWVRNFQITHGEAVAWGIGAALLFANQQNLASPEFVQEVFRYLEEENYFFPLNRGEGKEIAQMMLKDKKNISSSIYLILPRDWGWVEKGGPYSYPEIRSFLETLEERIYNPLEGC